MLALVLGIIFSNMVLGSEDYNLKVLDPRTVIPQEKKQELRDKLTLTLSSTRIDFGVINPTSAVIRENTIKVSTSGDFDYSLIAFEDHPLQTEGASATQDIPDTTCDNGTCREIFASSWINPLTFGFGMSLDGEKYRQFANEEASETKQSIKNGDNKQEIKVTYRLNTSKTQPIGVYSNTITYIVIPNF